MFDTFSTEFQEPLIRMTQYEALDLIVQVFMYAGLIGTLIIGFLQLKKHDASAQASCWLEIRNMFLVYDSIHKDLQADERWRTATGKPVTSSEIADIVAYMGVFELCFFLIKKGLLDFETFKSLYGYRVYVIMRSPRIVDATLRRNSRYWKDFIELARSLGLGNIPEPLDSDAGHEDISFPAGWT